MRVSGATSSTGRRLVVACVALLLAACASVPPPADALSGRLAVRVDGADGVAARNLSAAFDLRGDPSRGELGLSTPIGTMIARARWQPGDVRLETPDGERRFADLDGMAREVLGEAVPVAALFDWLRGRPWPGAPSSATGAGFEQLGWTVDLDGFADGRVEAVRRAPPAVTVRARLDRAS